MPPLHRVPEFGGALIVAHPLVFHHGHGIARHVDDDEIRHGEGQQNPYRQSRSSRELSPKVAVMANEIGSFGVRESGAGRVA